MNEKMILYKASVMAEKQGISFDVAIDQVREAVAAKQREKVKPKPRRVTKSSRKRKKGSKTQYTVNGRAITKIVSGGAPGLGRRS